MIDEADLATWDLPKLEDEWQKRAKLKAQMVGWLYPSILQDELIQIQRRQAELRRLMKVEAK